MSLFIDGGYYIQAEWYTTTHQSVEPVNAGETRKGSTDGRRRDIKSQKKGQRQGTKLLMFEKAEYFRATFMFI